MGADDDANCVEHQWQLAGASLGEDGSQLDYECTRCPAVMVETGEQLTGRVTPPGPAPR